MREGTLLAYTDITQDLTSLTRRVNLYDVLIRGERWIVLMLSPIVRDVQRQRCSKRGSGDGQRLSLYV